MGRILFDTATTLNGWIADESNSLDWLFAVEGGDEPSDDLYPATASVLVEGSTTYEWVLRHERLLEHPERWSELFGGGDLAGQFLDADALDEIAVRTPRVRGAGSALAAVSTPIAA